MCITYLLLIVYNVHNADDIHQRLDIHIFNEKNNIQMKLIALAFTHPSIVHVVRIFSIAAFNITVVHRIGGSKYTILEQLFEAHYARVSRVIESDSEYNVPHDLSPLGRC